MNMQVGKRFFPALGFLVTASIAAQAQNGFKSFGPLNEWNYPSFYEDFQGIRLSQMVDQNDPFSGIPPAEFLVGPLVISADPTQSNFFHESFYWFSNAFVTVPNRGDAELILALEGAFGNLDEALKDGDQTVFSRLRIRLRGDGFEAGQYRIETPYGTYLFDAPAVEPGRRIINETIDCLHVFLPPTPGGPTVICGSVPFGPGANYFTTPLGVLDDGTPAPQYAPNGPNFLMWDPAVLPLAPAGYMGDPNVPHQVTGAVAPNQNHFRIQYSPTGNFGNPVFDVSTDLFFVMGKLDLSDPCAEAPVVDFGASPLSGNAPLLVNFTNLSTCGDTWSWDFGDGGTSTAQSPSHVYTAAGTYSVTLEATGPGGTSSLTKPDLITVADAPGGTLVLASPVPGTAGVQNSLVVTGCTPGRTVGVYTGLRLGSSVVNIGNCGGLPIGLNRPFRLAGRAAANAGGIATILTTPPATAAGRVFHFQAAEPFSCRTSNIVSEQL
jgi:PKD repeat protein